MRKLSIRVLLLTGLSALSSVVMAASSIGNWNVYYGHLHNHTTVSDGSGSLDEAYSHARDEGGLDFFSTADHSEQISSSEWNNTKNVANSYNQDGVFTTFYAFEWSSGGHGHVTIVNTDDYCHSNQSSTNTFNELMTWLSSRDTVAFFNHPGRESNAFNHYEGTVSDKFVGMELWNKTDGFSRYYYNDGFHSNDGGMGHFDEALLRGWKIGASGAEDNHGTTWGTRVPFRKAILANNLTRADLFEAMKQRRFFSTLDKNIGLLIEMDSQPMGSTVYGGTNTIVIQANDADNEIFDRVELLKNGVVINTWYPNSSTPYISEVVNSADGDYYYARVRQMDGDEAISSPIWVSGAPVNQPPTWNSDPVTKADATEDAAYSATLAGESDDPESDPLTYAKVSGPAWLSVAADGTLSGTPADSDVGANSWTVSVSDGINPAVQATLNIDVINVNDAPVADAGNDQTVQDDDGNGTETVALDGSASDDIDGTIVAYTWKEGATTIATGATPSVTFAVGTHNITLEVEDNDGATDTDTVVITVLEQTANQDPTANAGANQTLTDSDLSGSEQVTLDGTASYDPDGSIVAYTWKEGSATIAAGANPTVDLAVGVHTITLEVEDDDGAVDTDTVVITVEEGQEVTCITAKNSAHKSAGRATSWWIFHFAKGSETYIGTSNTTTSLQETSPGYWDEVSSCP